MRVSPASRKCKLWKLLTNGILFWYIKLQIVTIHKAILEERRLLVLTLAFSVQFKAYVNPSKI